MTTAVNTLVTDISALLLDTGNVRWSTAELITYLTDGQLELVKLNPLANIVKTEITLVAGVEQSLPVTAFLLVSVDRNKAGAPITVVDKKDLDIINPSWMSDTAAAAVQHLMYDPNTPDIFFVYPAQPTTGMGTIIVELAVEPAAAVAGQNIAIDDRWVGALKEYVLYRAKSKDAEYAGEDGEANQHFSRFVSLSKGP